MGLSITNVVTIWWLVHSLEQASGTGLFVFNITFLNDVVNPDPATKNIQPSTQLQMYTITKSKSDI